jgi:hypothetical protein
LGVHRFAILTEAKQIIGSSRLGGANTMRVVLTDRWERGRILQQQPETNCGTVTEKGDPITRYFSNSVMEI